MRVESCQYGRTGGHREGAPGTRRYSANSYSSQTIWSKLSWTLGKLKGASVTSSRVLSKSIYAVSRAKHCLQTGVPQGGRTLRPSSPNRRSQMVFWMFQSVKIP